MSFLKSKYVLVNIQIPILLHETGEYDSYPDHIRVVYSSIDNLPPLSSTPSYELNLADYFPRETEPERENRPRPDPHPEPITISPLQELLTTVSETKYIEICKKNKAKIHKSNTTFKNKSPTATTSTNKNFPKKEFTRKTWKYLCEVNTDL